jgi:hypothetical protein
VKQALRRGSSARGRNGACVLSQAPLQNGEQLGLAEIAALRQQPEARNDRFLVHAESLGGFALVLHHWGAHRLAAIGGLIVTALAGAWGAASMSERLAETAQDRALEAVQASPAYARAMAELGETSGLYARALAEPVPEGLGPRTTEARSRAQARRLAGLERARAQAQARLEALTPAAQGVDWLALARGWGAMLAVLLGLPVFGVRRAPVDDEAAPERLTFAELGRRGAAARKAKAAEREARRQARNAYQREWRARRKHPLWAEDLFGALPN